MKKILLFIAFIVLVHTAMSQVSKTVNLTTAGTLSTELTATEKSTVTNLIVIGNIDARDFKTIRDDMPLLAVLDLGAVNIMAFTGVATATGSVTYPANEIPQYAFYNNSTSKGKTSFTSFIFPTSITSIGSNAFRKSGSGNLVIPNLVTTIKTSAFYDCYFNGTLTIPNSVTSIGMSAFELSTGFTGNLTIPNSVTSIGAYAFANCNNFKGSLTLPNSITKIEDGTFGACDGFTGSLIIPNTVTSIGYSAFQSCRQFTGSLTIPNTVTSIKYQAFSGCNNLTELTLSSNITTIDDRAFAYCVKLTKIHMPQSTPPTISSNTFGYIPKNLCRLYVPFGSSSAYKEANFWKEFTFISEPPVSVPSAGTLSSSLTATEKSTIKYLTIIGNIDARDFKTMRDDMPLLAVVYLDEANILAFTGAATAPGSVTYPANKIPQYAFYNNSTSTGKTSLTSIYFPTNVTSIEEHAFHGCSGLSGNLTIPNSVTTIESNAFYGCSGLSGNLTIPNSVTTIKENAFYGCSNVTELVLNNLTEIKDYAFGNCNNISKIFVPRSTPPIISAGTFNGINKSLCRLYVVPGSLTTYHSTNYWREFTHISESFYVASAGTLSTLLTDTQKSTITNLSLSGNIDARDFKTMRDDMPLLAVLNLEEVNIMAYDGNATDGGAFYPANEIPSSAFDTSPSKTSLTSITFPASITSIGESAFSGCSGLTGSLIIPNSVTTIADWAFSGCSSISGVLTLPEGLTIIGNNPFAGCIGLTAFSVPEANASFSSLDGVLFNKTKTTLIQCLGSKTGTFSIPNSVTSIGQYAFYNCSELSGSLTIPNSVTIIGENAFYGCSGFTGSLTISNSVTAIEYQVFYGCIGFTGSLNIPNSVTAIGSRSFEGCSGFIGSLTIPNSVTSIGVRAFYGCGGFTGSLTIPNSVTSIGNSAFFGCGNFTELTLPNNITTISNYAFYNCTKLTKIYMQRSTPPIVSISTFAGIPKNLCTLYVPVGATGSFRAANFWKDFTLMSEMVSTSTFTPQNSNLKIYSSHSEIIIEGIIAGQMVNIFSIDGKKVSSQISNGENVKIPVKTNGVYLVKVGERSSKVIL